MFHIAGKYLGNVEDIEDAVQIAFLRIAQNIQRFQQIPLIQSKQTENLVSIIIKNVSIDQPLVNLKDEVNNSNSEAVEQGSLRLF